MDREGEMNNCPACGKWHRVMGDTEYALHAKRVSSARESANTRSENQSHLADPAARGLGARLGDGADMLDDDYEPRDRWTRRDHEMTPTDSANLWAWWKYRRFGG